MKQTALILLAIVLVAVVALAVLVSTQPRANVTIRAIGPTGEFVTRTNELGKEVRGPSWQFAITNIGRAKADWDAYLNFKGPELTQREVREELDISLLRILAPGSGFVTDMAVPRQDDLLWSATITYFSTPSPLERMLWPVGRHVPLLHDLFPSEKEHFYHDVWHTTTNVAPTSALPQNGTNP